MSTPLVRYALDITGTSRNNLVLDEQHTLQDAHVRVLVPKYGPVYADSVRIIDSVSTQPLHRGVDYDFAELLQDPTIDFGKEVVQLALIKNPNVSSKVSITYQAVGGGYQNDMSSVSSALQTLLVDSRPVDWRTGVLNKQYQYPAGPHIHIFEDSVRFGSLVVSIERLAQAITLGSNPQFEALISWVQNFHKNWVSDDDIINMVSSETNISMKQLLFMIDKLNFNAITFRPGLRTVNLGNSVEFTVSATNFTPNELLYWTVEISDSPGTLPSMFGALEGSIRLHNQEAGFTVVTRRLRHKFGRFKFRVVLRRNGVDGPILADSGLVTMRNMDRSAASYASLASGMWDQVCCLEEPGISVTPESLFLVRDDIQMS